MNFEPSGEADYTLEEIEKMDRDALVEARDKVTAEIADIKVRLQEARTNARPHGKRRERQHADPGWYSWMSRCLATKGRIVGRIQVCLGKKNRAEKECKKVESEERARRFERAFMDQARRILPREQYDTLITETQAWFRAQGVNIDGNR